MSKTLSDPAAPQAMGIIDTPGDSVELTIKGGYLYIADGDAGLSVIELFSHEQSSRA